MLGPLLKTLISTYGMRYGRHLIVYVYRYFRRNGMTPASLPEIWKKTSFTPPRYIDREEALKILGLPADTSKKDVEDRFNKLFSLNRPDNGGSVYIQCKLIAAKQFLVEES